MGKRMQFKKYIGEGILIVFSVLFALFINRIAENRDLEKRKQTALTSIRQELYRNAGIMKSWRDQHSQIQAKLDSLLAGQKDSLLQLLAQQDYLDLGLLTDQQSLVAAVLSDTAWESAKSTTIISEFDFKTIERLTSVYKMQHVVSDETIRSILDVYFSKEAHDMRQLQGTLLQLQLRFYELVGQERLMAELYTDAIKSLE